MASSVGISLTGISVESLANYASALPRVANLRRQLFAPMLTALQSPAGSTNFAYYTFGAVAANLLAQNGDCIEVTLYEKHSAASTTRNISCALGYTSQPTTGFGTGLIYTKSVTTASLEFVHIVRFVRLSAGNQILMGNYVGANTSATQGQALTTGTLDETTALSLAIGINDATGTSLGDETVSWARAEFIPVGQ